LKFERFQEGLFVTAVAPAYRNLLGAQVLEMDDHGLAAIMAMAAPYISRDNDYWLSAVEPYRTALGIIHLDHPIDGYRFDDWVKYAEFDASPWFATAPTEKILELARYGWGDNESSTGAAKDCGGSDGSVADVLQYVMYLRHGGLRSAYKCFVNGVAALEWLAYHRPEVLAMLRVSQSRLVARVAV
jgi:hypothetical protein